MDNMEYSNKSFSILLTWSTAFRRLLNLIGIDLQNVLYEGTKKLFENSVNEKRCRVIASVMKGLFDYSINISDENQQNIFYKNYCDFFDLFISKAQVFEDILTNIFSYEGIIPKLCYNELILHICQLLESLTDKKTTIIQQVTYLKCLIYLYYSLMQLAYKYPKELRDLGETVLDIIKNYLKSKNNQVLQCAWSSVISICSTTFYLKGSKENSFTEKITDILNWIKSEIIEYNKKYTHIDSFDTFTEYFIYIIINIYYYRGEDNKLVSLISKTLPIPSPLLRPLPFVNELLVAAIRSNVYIYIFFFFFFFFFFFLYYYFYYYRWM